MSAETDLVKLYSDRILALATDIPHLVRLDTPDATVKRRAPLCGSTVTVDIALRDGKVSQFGQDVKACALGQAAASIAGRDGLKAMLKEDGPTPPAPFDGLEVLRPAKDYKNRHASILLTLDALSEAMDQVSQSDCG